MLAKRSLIFIFALALAVSFAIPAQQAEAGRRFLSIASGWVTGAYYPFAGAVSRVAWKHLKDKNIKVTAESSGASVANAKLISVGDTDFALLQNDIAAYAYRGEQMFKKPIKNIRGMMTLYPETIQIVARKDAGIKTVADLKGKRVSIGPLGSGTAENAKQVMGAYGLTVKDIKMQQMKSSQAADYMKDGRLDAYFNTTGVGAAHIIDTFVLVDAMIVPIDGDKADALIKKYPFYAKDVVAKDAYKGMGGDVNTIAVMAMMATSESMEADIVYTILKAIYSDLDQISKAHKKFSYIKLEKALNGMSIPLHAGAEKFFKEKGLVK
jgi:TRAP transporter TAXI family solute receptor